MTEIFLKRRVSAIIIFSKSETWRHKIYIRFSSSRASENRQFQVFEKTTEKIMKFFLQQIV